MKIKKWLSILLFIVICSPVIGAEKDDYYPLTPDSQWLYVITDHEKKNEQYEQVVIIDPPETYDNFLYNILKQKDKRGIVRAFVKKTEKGVFWKKIAASKSFTPEANSVFTPELPIILFPLTKGFTWDWQGRLKVAWINKNIKMHCTIMATDEEVTVPAGTFKCVKIFIQQIRDNEPSDEYGWYAPGIGQIKYETKRNLKVLKSYKVK